jgi:hypothetical protein
MSSLWKKLFELLIWFGWELPIGFGLYWNKLEEDVGTRVEELLV